MSADEYMPTTANVRDCYRFAAETPLSSIVQAEREFDRWLAAHDRDVAEKAWSEGHEAGRGYQGDGWNCETHDPELDNPYRKGQGDD